MMKIQEMQKKKRKGFSLVEILVSCAIIIALSVAAFFGYQHAQQTRKMAQMNNDLEAIANAALTYEALSLTSMPPTDIATLVQGLSADESIDGSEKTDLITTTKNTDNGILDPWGNAYEYSQTDRTITCTPNDASGAAMTPVVRHF